jgi:hypothetical protein
MKLHFCINRRLVNMLSLVLVTIGFWNQSYATLILDQQSGQFPVFTAGGWVASNGIDISQTFTAGMSGQLAGIEVAVSRNELETIEDLIVQIRSTTLDGKPDPLASNVLATASVSASDVNDWNSFSWVYVDFLAAGLFQNVGDVFAITLTSEASGTAYAWALTSGDPYSDGHGHYRFKSSGQDADFIRGGGDQFFRSYVVTSPSNIVLFTLGLALLAFSRSRFGMEPSI